MGYMSKMDKQYIKDHEAMLAKYEAMEKALLVMDDYDGGKMHIIKEIIKDLKMTMWWTM
jgi:hypothetical protein